MTANHVIKSTSMATYMGETMAWEDPVSNEE